MELNNGKFEARLPDPTENKTTRKHGTNIGRLLRLDYHEASDEFIHQISVNSSIDRMKNVE